MNHTPNIVTIDLSALLHNLNRVKDLVGSQTKIMGVVKSDAYGHGRVAVAKKLIDFQAKAYERQIESIRRAKDEALTIQEKLNLSPSDSKKNTLKP